MTDLKKQEILMIVAMTESGLIGNGSDLPWKSSIDMKHFAKQTTGWPCAFGKNTALDMPKFPLKNRPCSVISKSLLNMRANGGLGLGGAGANVFAAPESFIGFHKNFDRMFFCGGTHLYEYLIENNLVDGIIKTVFPDGYCEGDKYITPKTQTKIIEPYFRRELSQTLKQSKHFPDEYIVNQNDPLRIFETNQIMKPEDTKFPWIRFEVWYRRKQK